MTLDQDKRKILELVPFYVVCFACLVFAMYVTPKIRPVFEEAGIELSQMAYWFFSGVPFYIYGGLLCFSCVVVAWAYRTHRMDSGLISANTTFSIIYTVIFVALFLCILFNPTKEGIHPAPPLP